MFNSRDPKYRNPVGAVPCGQNLHFRIRLPRSLSCSKSELRVKKEGEREESSSMFWCGMNGDDAEWWECDYVPSEPGLYFYSFTVLTALGEQKIGKGVRNEATFSDGTWQLTVYEKEAHTPEWLAGGVMYQIFPDRFFASGSEKKGVPQDRFLHGAWGEEVCPIDAKAEKTNLDFFGGDLNGIREKLDYLVSLGVTCIYLNPIFEAHSNHRYNTADYSRIDPLLGTQEEFSQLCRCAKEHGIRILLDGVFSHTGSDSVYFDRYGRYGGSGAFCTKESPYYPWYDFQNWPEEYTCWWGIKSLPAVHETEKSFLSYITSENGIVSHWLRAGASGWRLDVADELPDEFIAALAKAAKREKPDALILGEVWEDASNKISYGRRRKYLFGDELDSVMNYPFQNAVLGFFSGKSGTDAAEEIETVMEHYPPQVIRLLMNTLGTHDTERALTVFGGNTQTLKAAALMQFTLPGVPCIYYGDEAGMTGGRDPYNRGCYPWGAENGDLLSFYRALGRLRAESAALREGSFRILCAKQQFLSYERVFGKERLTVLFNRSAEPRSVSAVQGAQVLFGALSTDGMPAMSFLLLRDFTV